MNFTFKLARRLARLKHALACVVAAASRHLSIAVRSARHPAHGITLSMSSDALLEWGSRGSRFHALASLLVLGLAACNPSLSTTGVTTDPSATVVLVGAGDIGDCSRTSDDSTAKLIERLAPDAVFTEAGLHHDCIAIIAPPGTGDNQGGTR